MREKTLFTLLIFLLISKNNTIYCKTGANMKNKNVYFVILAGGNGTRLWPLSRIDKPKQFLKVGNTKTLIEQSIDRVSNLALKENIWISTTENHASSVKSCVGEKIGNIVVEPGLRNTAPAILLACLEIQKINPQASIIFLPSDPFIQDKEKFVDYLEQAIDFISNNKKITLFGIKPTYPATGYGYIEFDNKTKKNPPYPVLKFHEKPNLKTAKKYLEKDNMAWNICMFCAKVEVFLEEFATCAPEIFQGVTKYANGQGDYNNVKSDSIDYAIMEKSKNTCVIPADFSWCDVGNIEVFLKIQKQNMQLENNIVSVNSENNLINVKDKLVALVGINNLCIVETDDVLLIINKKNAEQVREIVEKLKKQNKLHYL